jgi:hypothetical protein
LGVNSKSERVEAIAVWSEKPCKDGNKEAIIVEDMEPSTLHWDNRKGALRPLPSQVEEVKMSAYLNDFLLRRQHHWGTLITWGLL